MRRTEPATSARWLCCASLLPMLLIMLFSSATAQAQYTFSILTYNTENTFDTIPRPDGRDAEFLPDGAYHWRRGLYFHKLRSVAQVLLAADTLHPVDIAVLQEVESDTVLSDLLHRTPLASIPYDYLLTHSHDSRGINVAIVYSTYTFRLLHTDTIALPPTVHTRSVLHACGIIPTGDTLHIYAVHLPSKLGGATAERLRRHLCNLIAEHILSHTASSEKPLVLVCGDFNDTPSAKPLRLLARQAGLINLMKGLPGGSYRWQGFWQWLDQMLVSPALQQRLSPATPRPQALTIPFLLEPDATYGGKKPARAFFGPTWHGGFSDHLPVVLRLNL